MRPAAVILSMGLALAFTGPSLAQPAAALSPAAPPPSTPAPMPSPAAPPPSTPAPMPSPAPPGPTGPATGAPTLPAPTADAPVAITARVTPDPSSIGDVLTLEVTAAYPRNYAVNLPIGVKFDPFHLVDIQEGEPEATGEGLRKSYRIRLQHFETGPATIPSFTLTYVDQQGAIQTVRVPATEITVESLLANEADPVRKLEDPPVSIEYPNTTAEAIIYAVAATLVLAALAWWVVAAMLRRRRPVVVVPAAPAHEVALEALDKLEHSDLLAQGAVQDYYVELTEIAKAYLENRFHVDALDRTTDEIRRALLRETDRIAPLSAVEMVAFLQQCDLVKFARQQPATEEALEALGFVRQSVERSVPRAADPNKVVVRPFESEGETGKAEPAKAAPAKDATAKNPQNPPEAP